MPESDFIYESKLKQTELTQTGAVEDALINRLGGTGRVAYVVGAGTADGIINSIKEAPNHVPELATSVGLGLGMGYGLGALTKAGKFGNKAALIAGGALLAKWGYDEVTGDRWTGFGTAVSNAWNGVGSLEDGKNIAARSMGTFAFDTGVAMASGGAGFGLARKTVPMGWGETLVKNARMGASELAVAMSPEMAPAKVTSDAMVGRRGGTADLMAQEGMGRSLAAGDVKASAGADVVAQVKEILTPKKTYTSLADIGKVATDMLVQKDGIALGHKESMGRLTGELGEVTKGQSKLKAEIAELTAEQKALQTMSKEKAELTSAERARDQILEMRKQLPAKEAEVAQLDQAVKAEAKAKETGGKGKGKKEGGEGGEQGPSTKQKLQTAREQLRELKDATSDAALDRARVNVANKQEALTAAEQHATSRLEAIPGEITAKTELLTQSQSRTEALVGELKGVLDQYNGRITALQKDNSLFVEAPKGAADPALLAKIREASRGDGAHQKAKGEGPGGKPPDKHPGGGKKDARTDAGRPAERVAEKPAEVLPPDVAARQKADASLADAQKWIKPFEQQKVVRNLEVEKANIESGRTKFADEGAKATALEDANVRLAKAKADMAQARQAVGLRDGDPPKYTQTLKALHKFAEESANYLATETQAGLRDAYVKDAVVKLDGMMSNIENVYNGIPGKMPDLPKPGARPRPGQPQQMPELRLQQITDHLKTRIENIDSKQNLRVTEVAKTEVFSKLMDMHKAGELPPDGSAIFFLKDGTLLRQKGLNTPTFVDVARLEQGIGKEGAGLYRFIDVSKDLGGAVIIKPTLDGRGQPIKIRGSNIPKKEVVTTIGSVPAEITPGMPFGNLLNKFPANKAPHVEAVAKPAPAAPPEVTTKLGDAVVPVEEVAVKKPES